MSLNAKVVCRPFTFSRLLVGMLALTLAACATRPPAPARAPTAAPESVWLAHRAQIETLIDWQVQGRVAIRHEEDGWNAAFDWQQRAADYRVRLRGPFGQGAVELHGDAYGVWLRRQDTAPVYAESVDRLLEQETGWRLPVQGLQRWLVGLPVSDQPATFDWDAQGRLASLQQDGWTVDFLRYGDVQGYALPDRLRLRRDGLQVKVVVDSWQVP